MATLRTIKTPTSADMICVERGFVSAIIMIKPEPKTVHDKPYIGGLSGPSEHTY